MIDRRLRQNTVAEIEDMAGPSAGAVENQSCAPPNFGDLSEQRNRIEIALNRDAIAEPRPRLRKIDAPVEADNVAAGFTHEFEQVSSDGAEMDYRHRLMHCRNHIARV